jgi:hypothetical protein
VRRGEPGEHDAEGEGSHGAWQPNDVAQADLGLLLPEHRHSVCGYPGDIEGGEGVRSGVQDLTSSDNNNSWERITNSFTSLSLWRSIDEVCVHLR